MANFKHLEIKKINLKDIYKLQYNLFLTIYISGDYCNNQNESLEGLLILPGGGYCEVCSSREGEPVALSFITEGFNCFVLEYRTSQTFPNPQIDVCYALDYISKHSEEYNIRSHGVSLMGFSAGGHLACSYSYTFEQIAKNLNLKCEDVKPHAIILGYPVINDSYEQSGSTLSVISGNDKNLLELMRCDKHISNDFPPTYIWATKADNYISYKNSIALIKALKKANVLFKKHIYKLGEHGTTISTRAVYLKSYEKINEFLPNRTWVNEAADFIYNLKNPSKY